MADAVVLRETLDRVRVADEVGQHNQRQWGSKTEGCGTAYCFAGWRVVMDGGRLEGANSFRMPDGRLLHGAEIGDYARKRLGLSHEDAMVLFAMNNTLGDLAELVEEFSRG